MPRNFVAPTPVAGTHRSSRRRIGRERRQIGVILAIALLVGAGATPALATTAAATGAAQGLSQAATVTIQVTDLGTLPGGYGASARAINNVGQVTGTASDASGASQQVIWTDGTMIMAPALASWTTPEAINDSRQVVGTMLMGTMFADGILWDPSGQAFVLPPVPGGYADWVTAHDINASGVIVGRSRDAALRDHCVLWQGTTLIRDLGFIGSGNYCDAYGINDLGDIVGNANTVSGAQPRGFLWRNGSFTQLVGVASAAVDINNSGLIAGTNGGIAAVWRNGVIETLPALAGGTVYNHVTDLNNNGDVVGYGQSPSGVHMDTPILWRGGTAIDLGRWPGGTESRAYGMNDNGQIVGEGNLVDGGPGHALMWTVSAPSTNTAPVVNLAATSATTINRGGSVTFVGNFSDLDAGPWTYTFDWGNGTTSGTAASPGSIAATRTYASTGRYKVTLTVTDSRGAKGTSAPISVRVR
jgi:probable HAF family extracellular repeat protein